MTQLVVANHARHIWNSLGPGYSERVYHNAMEVCLRRSGIPYETERIIPIVFDGHVLGNLRADLIVDRNLIVELKSVRAIKEEHHIQARLYLQLLGLNDAMLINFPSNPTITPDIVTLSLSSVSLPT
jgi:GxxExxY protein